MNKKYIPILLIMIVGLASWFYWRPADNTLSSVTKGAQVNALNLPSSNDLNETQARNEKQIIDNDGKSGQMPQNEKPWAAKTASASEQVAPPKRFKRPKISKGKDASGITLNFSDTDGTLSIDLDRGVQLPVAMMDDRQDLPAPVQKVKDHLAEEFMSELKKVLNDGQISNSTENNTSSNSEKSSASNTEPTPEKEAVSIDKPEEPEEEIESPTEAYKRIVQKYNERYRALFGDDAFNRLTVQAAREAISPDAGE